MIMFSFLSWSNEVSSSLAGLQILYTLLQNVSGEEAAAQSFYQTYFCDILQHIFSVVTDTSHTAGKRTDVMATGTCVEMLNRIFFSNVYICEFLISFRGPNFIYAPTCLLPVYRSDHARHHLGLHV